MFVVVFWVSPVAPLVRVTVALDRTAADGSVTVPLTAPVTMLCALVMDTVDNRIANHTTNFAAHRYPMSTSSSQVTRGRLTGASVQLIYFLDDIAPVQREAIVPPQVGICKLLRFIAQFVTCAR